MNNLGQKEIVAELRQAKRRREAAENLAENQDILETLEDGGFTRADLADALGISPQMLGRLLRMNLTYDGRKAHMLKAIQRMVAQREEYKAIGRDEHDR